MTTRITSPVMIPNAIMALFVFDVPEDGDDLVLRFQVGLEKLNLLFATAVNAVDEIRRKHREDE